MKKLSLGPKNLSVFDLTTQFHHIFFFGDLNYRLGGIEPTVSVLSHSFNLYCFFFRDSSEGNAQVYALITFAI